MTTVGSVAGNFPRPSWAAKRRWSWPHYLALVGVAHSVLGVLDDHCLAADGPRQITEFRDTESASWYAARVFES